MPTEIPKLPPERVAAIDRFHTDSISMIDHYVGSLGVDMRRHKVKHGEMDGSRAHNDITLLLAQQLPKNILAGMCAELLLREIKKGK